MPQLSTSIILAYLPCPHYILTRLLADRTWAMQTFQADRTHWESPNREFNYHWNLCSISIVDIIHLTLPFFKFHDWLNCVSNEAHHDHWAQNATAAWLCVLQINIQVKHQWAVKKKNKNNNIHKILRGNTVAGFISHSLASSSSSILLSSVEIITMN